MCSTPINREHFDRFRVPTQRPTPCAFTKGRQKQGKEARRRVARRLSSFPMLPPPGRAMLPACHILKFNAVCQTEYYT